MDVSTFAPDLQFSDPFFFFAHSLSIDAMQSRIELLTRSLDVFQQRDTGVKQVPVFNETTDTQFGDSLTRLLNEASDAGMASGDIQKRFAAGENVELHEVMAASEEAGIALDLVIELRNKTVEAYRTLISMQG